MEVSNFKQYTQSQAKEIVKAFNNLNIKEVEIKGEGTFKVIATTEAIDRDGESIKIDAWDFDNFKKNPVMLFAHDYWKLPVGAATNLKVENGQVIVEGVFARHEEAQKIRQLYEDGILRTVSVGFIAKERDGNTITKAELLEVSFVPVPSNPEALDARGKKAIKDLTEMFLKTVVPEQETPKIDEEAEWDATAATKRIEEWSKDEEGNMDWAKYSKGFAWYDGEDPEKLGSYKLPHHDMRGDELVVVWRGVAAAMSALLGAQGGVDIPDNERRGVYDHLVVHYEQFEKEPPEFSTPEEGGGLDEEDVDEEDAKTILSQLKKDINCLVADASERLGTVSGIKLSGEPIASKGQKAGRTLSAKTKRSIVAAIESAEKAVKDLKTLLEQAEGENPEPKEADKEQVKRLQTIDKLIEESIKAAKLNTK